MVYYFKGLFFSNNNVIQDRLLVEELVPYLIDDKLYQILAMTHSLNEIKNEIFDLKSNGVYGPGGFGAFFFQKY